MKKVHRFLIAALLLLSLSLVACAELPPVVEVPGTIILNPNSAILNRPDKNEPENDYYSGEQESMAGSNIVIMPTLPAGK